MLDFQTPYCANGHDGIPMIHTSSDNYQNKATRIYTCPQCGRKIKLIKDEHGHIKIKEVFD